MRKAVRAIVVQDGKLLVIRRNKFGSVYYTLPGGGIDPGETAEQALVREMAEETSVQVEIDRQVYVEDAGDPFGIQYVFLCHYVNGEPALHPESEEAIITAMGQNLYIPEWVPLDSIRDVNFRTDKLRTALLRDWPMGFKEKVETL